MERKFKKGRMLGATRKHKNVTEKKLSPVDKVDFLLQLTRLQGTLLQQLKKEV